MWENLRRCASQEALTNGVSPDTTVESKAGKGDLPFGDEFVSYIYQPHQTDVSQGIVMMTSGLGDGVEEEYDPGVAILAANGYATIKVAEPAGDGRVRLPKLQRATVIDQHAADAVWVVKDHIVPGSEQRIILFGPSMGGRTALKAAEQRPEEVEGVILVNPALCPPGSTFSEMFGRYSMNGLRNYLNGDHNFKKGTIKTIKRLVAAPIKSIARGFNALEQDLPSIIFNLAEKDIKAAIILGKQDDVFTAEATVNCVLDYFYETYAKRRDEGVVYNKSFYHMLPEIIVNENGGHFMDDYAQHGLNVVRHVRQREREPRSRRREGVIFEANGN